MHYQRTKFAVCIAAVLRSLICLLMLAVAGVSASTAPGTIIQNQAQLSYVDADGRAITTLSNIATLAVGRYYDFSVNSNRGATAVAGERLSFSHQLVNTGNIADSYFLSGSAVQTDVTSGESPLQQIMVYHDLNGNGIVDADEPEIIQTPAVEPGQTYDIVVAAMVPEGVPPGRALSLELSVKSIASTAIAKLVVDEITIEIGAVLEIEKHSEPECSVALFPGDLVTHHIDVSNIGSSAIDGIKLMLDGAVVQGVVVEHAIPEHMVFNSISYVPLQSMATPVIRIAGVAENSWLGVDQWDGVAQVVSAGILFTAQQLPAQAVESFRVDMRVLEFSSDATLVSTAAVVDTDGDRIADFRSNNTCHTFSVPNAAQHARLRFLEPAENLIAIGASPDFNSDADFVQALQYRLDAGTGYRPATDGVYLELQLSPAAQSVNVKRDSAGNRYVIAELESSLTGDIVNMVLLETTTAGLYRSVSSLVLSAGQRSGGGHCPLLPDGNTELLPEYDQPSSSCYLASGSDDELQGRYLDTTSGFAIAEVALVQPRAMVFNAQTLAAVEGAVVSVRLAATDQIAMNPATGAPLSWITGPDGYYELPRLRPGVSYYLHVEPPEAHRFPSVVTAEQFPLFNVTGISYGRTGDTFSVARAQPLPPVDIPLDSSVSGVSLSVEKVALQTDVLPGQIVSYNIAIKNFEARPVSAVRIKDRPPYGYRYVPMSTTLNGEAVVGPDRADDGTLEFSIGTLEPGAMINLVYALRASAAAVDSDGINSAVATGINGDNALVVSPESRTRVTLRREGVLSDRAAMFGKLYVDQNCDGVQNNKEWPVGGVRLYLQDGTYTVSDADGLFSLYGLRPGSHVIKVDNHTMPAGLELKPLDSNQGVDPNSRFVDLMTGDFHRVDFAAVCPRQDVDRIFAEIKARNESINGSWLLKEAEQFRAGEELQVRDPGSLVRSVDGDLSSGLLDGPRQEDGSTNSHDALNTAIVQLAQEQSSADPKLPVPKEIVSTITQQQAKAGTWLWPPGEHSVKGRFMAVIRDGIEPTLYVNNEAVPASQIGERMANRREKAQVVAWYGVELKPGENTVEIKGRGPFGNERILATGSFKKPSSGSQIRLTAEHNTIQADGGRSVLPVKIEVLDDHGYPALGVYFVTLESSDGSWVEPDIQDSEPGRQVRVNNGVRVVHFTSSEQTGHITLRAGTGEFSDDLSIQQVSESRPLTGVGFIELGARVSSTRYGGFAPSRPLQSLDGNSRIYSRAALFAKGQVKNDYNLTLAYDSEKDSEAQLLRDINPSQHYPIHGDASIRGYEAQSRSKLYVKLERDDRSVMWGDFLTDSTSDHEDLARARRTLTGVNSVIEDNQNRLRFFAARQQDQRQHEEVAGNGSAMLYRLKSYPIVANSEVVELVTRSRDNPGLVVASSRLSRFGDYTIDPVYGYLTFSTAIPTLDDQQNPVFIKISYDVENGGDNYLISGFRFDRDVNDSVRIGFSHTSDNHSESGNNLSGFYATYKNDKRTRVSASVAASDSVENGVGRAAQVTVDHTWHGASQARTKLTYARADAGFTNSGSSVAAGRIETRINHKQKLKNDSTVVLDAVQSDSAVNPESRRTLSAVLESRLREWLVRAGLRHITQQDFSNNDQFVTAIVGAGKSFTIGDRVGQVDAEYEQDTSHTGRNRLSLGARLQLHEKARAYSNFELSNSLLALTGTSNNQKSESMTLGIETTILPSSRLYSEYRMRGAFDSRDFETATGIRGDYELQEGLRVSPGIEIINTVDGLSDNGSLAASVGVSDTRNPNSRKLFRLETRQTDQSDYVGFKASYAARMNEDWTAVLTENLSRQDNAIGQDTLRHSFVASFARRPKLNNRHHMLMMYNWKEERGLGADTDRSVHLLSTHQNLQLSNGSVLTGRFAGKRHSTRFGGRESTGFALLGDVRLNFDFNRRVNVDVRGGVLTTDGAKQIRYSAGAGIYYLLNKNAKIGIGYNFAGFKDDDLDAEEYNAQGWRLGLQYKFDEDSLKWLE